MPEGDSAMGDSPGDSSCPLPAGFCPLCGDKLLWECFLEPREAAGAGGICHLSGAFFISPKPWARLLKLPGFPHFGNLSGKGGGTGDALSPPGQLRLSLPLCQSPAQPGSIHCSCSRCSRCSRSSRSSRSDRTPCPARPCSEIFAKGG